MKHFLFEFITGGGLTGQVLPKSLIREGQIMTKVLLNELIDCNNIQITTTTDSRIEPYRNDIVEYIFDPHIKRILPEIIKKSDICWLIAPESGNSLYNLTNLFLENANLFIGSDLKSVKIASSKLTVSKVLENKNICTPESKLLNDIIPESKTGWVVKPDDGVGADNCIFIRNKSELNEIISARLEDNYIIQPFIKGKHMSMSLFIYNGDVQLLAANKQEIILEDNKISPVSIGVNEYLIYKSEMKELAESIVSVIPGLSGYVGVDLVRTKNNLYVIDINPRFTTSYAGISQSLGVNITEKILNTFLDRKMQDISFSHAKTIKLNLL